MDPPWLMTGRSLTAWFMVPWQTIEASLSPDLRPDYADSTRIRLRFYDLTYTALSDDRPGVTAPRSGRFREAVFGVPARFGETVGEVSVCMWADGSDYIAWGREVFGWPVLPGWFELEGGFWDGGTAPGTSAKMNAAAGSVAAGRRGPLAGKLPASPAGSLADATTTPRARRPRRGRPRHARRPARGPPSRATVLGILPGGRRPRSGTSVRLADDPRRRVEGADGFEIVVGANVDVL